MLNKLLKKKKPAPKVTDKPPGQGQGHAQGTSQKPKGEEEGCVSSEDWDIEFEDLQFEEQVGSGAFGTVFKGDYLGVPVAIKRLNPVAGLSPDQVDKYIRREVSLLKGIHHPNIVQFMGLCKHENTQYIVTEYVTGGNLKDYLEQNEPTWRIKVILALDIAVAFNFMHKKSLIYRDIKPENLLVTENLRIKVCDLGLARTKSKAHYMTIAGSDDYMAPEVLMGEQYGEKCDVFGFGTLLGVIAARRKMPPRNAMTAYAYNLTQVERMMPSDCPPKLLNLILSCCKTDPDDRPGFTQVVATLKEILKEVESEGSSSYDDYSDLALPPVPDRDPYDYHQSKDFPPPPSLTGSAYEDEVAPLPSPNRKKSLPERPVPTAPGSPGGGGGRPPAATVTGAAPTAATANDFFTQRFMQKEKKLEKKVGTGVSTVLPNENGEDAY